jgi:hypothetical protein
VTVDEARQVAQVWARKRASRGLPIPRLTFGVYRSMQPEERQAMGVLGERAFRMVAKAEVSA